MNSTESVPRDKTLSGESMIALSHAVATLFGAAVARKESKSISFGIRAGVFLENSLYHPILTAQGIARRLHDLSYEHDLKVLAGYAYQTILEVGSDADRSRAQEEISSIPWIRADRHFLGGVRAAFLNSAKIKAISALDQDSRRPTHGAPSGQGAQ